MPQINTNVDNAVGSDEVKTSRKQTKFQSTSDVKLDKAGRKIKAHRIKFMDGIDDGKKGVTEQMKKTYKDFVEQHTPDLTEEQKNELVAELQEVLAADDSAGKWISDFVHSDNPKFAGKSKEKRKQMALAAYYSAKRNEEFEHIDELHATTLKSYANKRMDTVKSRYADLTAKQHAGQSISNKDMSDYNSATKKDLNNINKARDKAAHKLMVPSMAREEVELDEVSFSGSHQGKTTLKHIKNPTVTQRMAAHDIKPGIKGYRDRIDLLKAAKAQGNLKEEDEIEESVFDWKNKPRQTSDKSTTATKHDVKKTSTGTVYTKQRDADGMSKEFKRDNEPAQKRGRGRPKKNSFGEAVEFLMGLDEETFDSLMEEGFDAFMEEFEQLDELSKTTLGSYARKAAASAVSKTAQAQHATAQSQAARERAKNPKLAFARSGNETVAKMQADSAVKANVKAGKRLSGVSKAVDRLTK